MSENYNSNINSQFIMNLLKSNNHSINIMPSYMRNINSIIETKQEISKISWEKEGEEVIFFKFVANQQRKNIIDARRKTNNKTFNYKRGASRKTI